MSTANITIDVQDLPSLATKSQVAEWLNCSDRHVDLMVREDRFPRPIYVSVRSPRWRRSDLLAFLDAQSNPASADD